MSKITTIQWVIDEMEAWAPTFWAEEDDNVGLLIGNAQNSIKKILVAIDATDAVVQEAIAGGYNCIITHHPLTYTPLKRITADCTIGRKILAMAKHDISLYSAHTNLDKAPGGVNDCLAEKLGISNTIPLVKDAFGDDIGFGRIGELPTGITLRELAVHVKKSLDLKDIRYSGDLSRKIKKVAICGGSGMSFWRSASDTNCDVYITGDAKYSDALSALASGLCLLDITHYSGENIIIEAIVERLRTKAEQDDISLKINATTVNGQAFYAL